MKKILITIGVALMTTVIHAQTNTPPANTPAFYQQLLTWASSIDTNNNSTFVAARGLISTGVESSQNTGVSLDNYIAGQFDLLANVTNGGLRMDINVKERDSGVQGTFVSGQGGIGLGYVIHDLRLDLNLDGGYYNYNPDTTQKVFGEADFIVRKALGTHTFMEVMLEEQFPHTSRFFGAGAGFSF